MKASELIHNLSFEIMMHGDSELQIELEDENGEIEKLSPRVHVGSEFPNGDIFLYLSKQEKDAE